MYQIAIPNKGALSDAAVQILSDAGYKCKRYSRELVVRDAEHEVEFVYLRPRDIAIYVGSGVVNAGITGRDLWQDSRANVTEHLGLNIGKSRFCYAIPNDKDWTPDDLGGKRIATSYAAIVEDDMKARGKNAEIVRLDGAVEISIQLGVADAIADVVESGRTLYEAGLKIIGEPIMHSEAVVVTRNGAEPCEQFKQLLARIEGILVAREYVLLEYDAPKDKLDACCAITPGVQSPTLSPLSDQNWVAVAAMVKNKGLNKVIDALQAEGARAIIAQAIKTCRF